MEATPILGRFGLCDEPIQFDHIHARVFGGSESLDNFAPLIAGHHLKKTKAETRARAKIDRITGKTGAKKRERAKKRKIARLKRELWKAERA